MAVQRQTKLSRPAKWGLAFAVIGALVAVRALTIQPMDPVPFTSDSRPVILAHQGASGHVPSNTLEAYRKGIEQGADIIDIDIHKTKDGVIVASHDDTIDRLTNGSGLIREMTLAELRQYDYGYDFTPDEGKSFAYRGKGLTIPTLEEIFQAFPGHRINMEIKQSEPPMAAEVWELVQKYQREDTVMVESFASDPMKRWKELAGNRVATCANRSQMYVFAAFWIPHLDWLYQPDVNAFCLPVKQKLGPFTIDLSSTRLLNRAHQVGVKVYYWTVNDEPTMARLLENGADGIFTDFPDRAMKVMKEKGLR